MRGAKIKRKLSAGQPVFTASIAFHAPRLVEMLCYSGVDQIFLDAEHGPISEADCEDMVRAADLHETAVQIRVPVNEPHVILRFLDVGASNIMVPHVNTREDAERAVMACRYPPEGGRGFAPGRGGYRLGLSPTEYMLRANEETLVTALFEDVAGIGQIEAIAQTPGLNGVFVGPFDLASSMGLPGQPWHEDVQKVVTRVRDACLKHKMPFGTLPRGRDALKTQIEQGCQLISVGPVDWGIALTRETIDDLAGVTPTA